MMIASLVREWRATMALAVPMIAGQVGQMLMGVADTIMIGRVGVTELAAATFVSTLMAVPFVIAIGLLSSVSVRVANAVGAGDARQAREALQHGTWLAAAYSLGVLALTLAALPVLDLFGQPEQVTARAPVYLLWIAVSLIPALLSLTWKNHADALSHPWPPFWIILGGVGLNVLLNWLWIYGHWGFPAWGLEGAGMATLVARVVTAIVMLVWLAKSPVVSRWYSRQWFTGLHLAAFGALVRLGIPASLQLLAEVTAFAAAALLIGTLGAVPLAAHQIAMTCVATTFMVPLGVGMAATVRIGELAGAMEHSRMHTVLVGGWVSGVAFMSGSMAGFLLAGRELAGLFVRDVTVAELAARLLIVGGLFQLFDGLQVISASALRGMGDVRVPALIAFVAYWGIALPVGAWFAFGAGHGAVGMWAGLAIGLVAAAGALSRRAWVRLV